MLALLRSPANPNQSGIGDWPGTQMAVQSAGVIRGYRHRYPPTRRPQAIHLSYTVGPREIDDGYASSTSVSTLWLPRVAWHRSCAVAALFFFLENFILSAYWGLLAGRCLVTLLLSSSSSSAHYMSEAGLIL